MANHSSSIKSIRKTKTRTIRNRQNTSRMRTYVRKVEEAIGLGDKAKAQEAFREMQPVLMRTSSKGLLHANTVSRKLSRLSARIKAL